ncbi:SRPBCC family protein [Microtetraspora sp. NBRC 16547]|uniref:SRPBCC family protein n=1 Tax=Microtetraspora sp. NBRC 16547 TaxID=3030993 RepID=UPI002556911D|nr:SRPBCC family protein [Microtetraspora sp. NBRC 16547]
MLVERSPLRRTLGAAGAGVCAGVVIEYLCDPDRGRTRRALVRDKAAHATHKMQNSFTVLSSDLPNRGRGALAAARHRILTERDVDDRVLHERVRAQLGRYVAHPHAVEVHVDDRIVTLSGDILSEEDRRARWAVRRVAGVRRVDCRWKTHPEAGDTPGLQGTSRTRRPVPELLQQRWSPTARFLVGSSAMLTWGVSGGLPQPFSWTVRAACAVLLVRAATNLPLRRLTGISSGRRAVDVQDAISIAAPAEDIWALVSDYSFFARIMPDVREVRLLSDGRSHWVIAGPAGTSIRFDVVETRREKGREIAWKTVEGQLFAHTGALRLTSDAEGRTRVQVQMAYNPAVGALGHAMAKLLGVDPVKKLRQDLMRLKTFVEIERPAATRPAATHV